MTTAPARKTAPYFSYVTDVEVDVDIDPDDLHKDGWHHETECDTQCKHEPAYVRPLTLDRVTRADAIASLHRQAHPGQLADPYVCHEEPCRSLTYQQLHGEAS